MNVRPFDSQSASQNAATQLNETTISKKSKQAKASGASTPSARGPAPGAEARSGWPNIAQKTALGANLSQAQTAAMVAARASLAPGVSEGTAASGGLTQPAQGPGSRPNAAPYTRYVASPTSESTGQTQSAQQSLAQAASSRGASWDAKKAAPYADLMNKSDKALLNAVAQDIKTPGKSAQLPVEFKTFNPAGPNAPTAAAVGNDIYINQESLSKARSGGQAAAAGLAAVVREELAEAAFQDQKQKFSKGDFGEEVASRMSGKWNQLSERQKSAIKAQDDVTTFRTGDGLVTGEAAVASIPSNLTTQTAQRSLTQAAASRPGSWDAEKAAPYADLMNKSDKALMQAVKQDLKTPGKSEQLPVEFKTFDPASANAPTAAAVGNDIYLNQEALAKARSGGQAAVADFTAVVREELAEAAFQDQKQKFSNGDFGEEVASRMSGKWNQLTERQKSAIQAQDDVTTFRTGDGLVTGEASIPSIPSGITAAQRGNFQDAQNYISDVYDNSLDMGENAISSDSDESRALDKLRDVFSEVNNELAQTAGKLDLFMRRMDGLGDKKFDDDRTRFYQEMNKEVQQVFRKIEFNPHLDKLWNGADAKASQEYKEKQNQVISNVTLGMTLATGLVNGLGALSLAAAKTAISSADNALGVGMDVIGGASWATSMEGSKGRSKSVGGSTVGAISDIFKKFIDKSIDNGAKGLAEETARTIANQAVDIAKASENMQVYKLLNEWSNEDAGVAAAYYHTPDDNSWYENQINEMKYYDARIYKDTSPWNETDYNLDVYPRNGGYRAPGGPGFTASVQSDSVTTS